MNALILAAGRGSRLGALTDKVPKCMVRYQNAPIIEHEIAALREGGARKIALVGGYLSEVLREHINGRESRVVGGVEGFFTNARFAHTNMVATMFCAREFMRESARERRDLLVSYSDIVYKKAVVESLKNARGELCVAVDKCWQRLWERRFGEALFDAETLKMNGEKIIELGKKPKNLGDIEGQYIGLFKISHEFLDEMMAFYDRLDRAANYDGKDFENMYMTSFIQQIIERFGNVFATEIFGGWVEIDSPSDLAVACV